MNDVTCPYCKQDQEINHDDGYGYNDYEEYEQACIHCDKSFKFTTTITYIYNVQCQSGDHDMQPFGDRWPGMYECSKCDYYMKEREQIFDSVGAG